MSTLGFRFFTDGNQFQRFVARLFAADGTHQSSPVFGYKCVGSDYEGDMGIDGYTVQGVIFQAYYPLSYACESVTLACRGKVRETFAKLRKNLGAVQEAIGCAVKGIVFVFPHEPGQSLQRVARECSAATPPLRQTDVWGETQLNDMLWRHPEVLSDFLPLLTERLRRILPIYEEILHVHAPLAALLVDRAIALFRIGDLDGADELLCEAHTALPDDPRVLSNLALVRLWRGRLPEAADYADRAWQRCPNDHRVLNTRAMVELERGNASESLALLDRAMGICPSSDEIRRNRACVAEEVRIGSDGTRLG
jgi:tetratricopeptide (TPR) repeat protein